MLTGILKRGLAMFLVVLQVFTFMPVYAGEVNAQGITMVDDSNIYEKTKYYKPGLLGVAGGFHLVGFESVETASHVHGNILANKLIYQSNFGSKNVEEVSYIKILNGGSGMQATGNDKSILVVGRDIDAGVEDNGNAWGLNRNKVTNPDKRRSPNSLWQDGSREFIELDKLEKEMKDLSFRLGKLLNNKTEIRNTDRNKQEIRVLATDEFNIYNMEANDFDFNTPIKIEGFDKNQISTLIINVDMSKMLYKNSFNIPQSIIHYKDGSQAPTGEVSTWQNANVIWNIYDSSNAENIFTGTITNSDAVTGTILSPGADIRLSKNLNGTIIGNIISNSGETHRDDYVDKPEFVNIPVNKVWIGKGKDRAVIKLLQDGSEIDRVELNNENNWRHIFKNLPKKTEDDLLIKYTIEEVEIEGYTSSITGSQDGGFTVKNIESKKDIPVKKVWIGGEGKDIEVKLYGNNIELKSVILNKDNDWEHIFKDLDRYKDGKEIEYTVKEFKAPVGYESEIKGCMNTGFIIVNTSIGIDIPVKKIWEGEPLENIKLVLLADGDEIDHISLDSNSDWSHVFNNLPKFNKNNEEINYEIKELDIDDRYESKITGNATRGFIITNTEKPINPEEPDKMEIDIPVEKIWKGKALDEIHVALYKNGEAYMEVALNAKNNWKHVFEKLDRYDNEELIKYTIKELNIPEGYESKITKNIDKGFTITNTEKPVEPSVEKISIPIKKVWMGKPLKSVDFNLYRDGEKIDTISLSDENSWTYVFNDLDKYKDGREISYVVKEDTTPGYSQAVYGNANQGYVFINIEIPVEPPVEIKKSLSVDKIWKGKKQESITVDLLMNGEILESVSLSDENDWHYTFTDLDYYDKNDNIIEYTVSERENQGYSLAILGNGDVGFTLINIEIPVTPPAEYRKSLNVKKVWEGRPKEEVTIKILADGKELKKVKLNDKNNWKYEFKDLLVINRTNGEYIKYEIVEENIAGYTSKITGSFDDGFIVTNTEKPTPPVEPPTPLEPEDKLSIPVKKSWIGGMEDFVVVNLVANYEIIDKVKLSDSNNWRYVFKNLARKDKYGKDIDYSIFEDYTKGYENEIKGNPKDGFELINRKTSIKNEKISIPVRKIWEASPKDSVKIRLFADNKEIRNIDLSDENTWKYEFKDLPKFDLETGKLIDYSIEEDAIEGYITRIEGDMNMGFKVINALEPNIPEEPIEPDEPIEPTNPEKPGKPKEPNKPEKPNKPNKPKTPVYSDNPQTYREGILFDVILISIILGVLFILERKKKIS